MKLRIRSNSLRLRLGPQEVKRLLRDGAVEEILRFGPLDEQMLRYRLELDPDASALSARLLATGIVVSIPPASAVSWAGGPELGIQASQPVGDGQPLHVLVEKDLQCLEGPAEGNEDVYPNPSRSCA